MAPTISVLLPVFDSERYLREAARSILNQSYADLELIIIDDGSTDGTLGVARALSDEDARVRLVAHKENRGLAVRLNEGLSLAQGEYIARMDADDVSVRRRFELQLNHLQRHPDVALVGGFIRYFGGRRSCLVKVATYPLHISWRLLFGNSIGHVTVLARRRFFDGLGGYDETLRVAQDYDLWLKARDRYLMSNIPEVLVDVREDPLSTARRLSSDRRSNALNALNRVHSVLLSSEIPIEVTNLCVDPNVLRVDRSLVGHIEETARTIEALAKIQLADPRMTPEVAKRILSDARYKLAQLVLLGGQTLLRRPALRSALLRRRDLATAVWKHTSHLARRRLKGCS